MHGIILIGLFCLGVALAYPVEEETLYPEALQVEDLERPLLRSARQVFVQGGGSRGQGFDVHGKAQFPIWEKGPNSVQGTVGYSQHLGGPYGNSRPDVRGGVIFTHRF